MSTRTFTYNDTLQANTETSNRLIGSRFISNTSNVLRFMNATLCHRDSIRAFDCRRIAIVSRLLRVHSSAVDRRQRTGRRRHSRRDGKSSVRSRRTAASEDHVDTRRPDDADFRRTLRHPGNGDVDDSERSGPLSGRPVDVFLTLVFITFI